MWLSLRLRCYLFLSQLVLDGILINIGTSSSDLFHVRHSRVFLTIENGVNLLESFAFCFDPEIPLSITKSAICVKKEILQEERLGGVTCNEKECNNVPTAIDHVHPPSDIVDANRHDEHEYQSP